MEEPPSDRQRGAARAAGEPSLPRGALGAARWAEIRRLYEETETPNAEIYRRFGVTPGQLRWRREAEAWADRPPASADAVLRQRTSSPERLRRRLLTLHNILLGRLEAKIAEADEFDMGQAQALAMMAKAWDPMNRPKPTRTRPSGAGDRTKAAREAGEKKNKDDGTATVDVAWLRAEIKRRLHQLRQSDEP